MAGQPNTDHYYTEQNEDKPARETDNMRKVVLEATNKNETGSKTHKRLKERFLIRRIKTKRANFRGNPLFQATYNTKEKS